MKIKFIPLLFVLGYLSVDAQIMSTDGASVYVSPNTLLFSTGDVKVTSDAGVFTNEGNIEISSGTISSDKADNFILTYTDVSNYGQLIVKSNQKSTGEITVQKQIMNSSDEQVTIGVPFVGYTYSDFSQDVIGATSGPDTPCNAVDGLDFAYYNSKCFASQNWLKQPLFLWSNEYLRYDPYENVSGKTFTPGLSYVARKDIYQNLNTGGTTTAFTNVINFEGTPMIAGSNNGLSAVSYPVRANQTTKQGGKFTIGDGKHNPYWIYYYTYLEDPFVDLNTSFDKTTTESALTAANFADRTLHLVNPYTSNLDLSVLTNSFTGLAGISIPQGTATYSTATTRTKPNDPFKMTFDVAGQLLGDVELKIIPPMTPFTVKSYEGGATSLDLYSNTDALTFSASDIPTTILGRSLSMARSSFSTSNNYQLRLVMSVNDVEYARTYLVAGNLFETGVTGKPEAQIISKGEGVTTLYTLPEAETGGVALGKEEGKLYINVMNSASSKVAIPLGVSIADNDKGSEIKFTSDLKQNAKSLSAESLNFSDPDAKFYFHDKEKNVVKEIDSKFSYSVKLNESTNDRFEIFWSDSGLISKEEDDNVIDDNVINDNVVDDNDNDNKGNSSNITSNITSIYKTGTDYKVRFNSNWNKADVTVFNVVGQLVSSEKNVNTQTDYLIPLYKNASTMYIVVITNPVTGEKITKKIVN